MLRRALIVGVLAGAIFLGAGTRLAMRGVAHIEQRVPVWTINGTLEVVMFGALFGLAFSLVWALVGQRIRGTASFEDCCSGCSRRFWRHLD